jgi:hypothetical protein
MRSADRGEDLVEAGGELGIPIADEERLTLSQLGAPELRRDPTEVGPMGHHRTKVRAQIPG